MSTTRNSSSAGPVLPRRGRLADPFDQVIERSLSIVPDELHCDVRRGNRVRRWRQDEVCVVLLCKRLLQLRRFYRYCELMFHIGVSDG
jgi:hypothetical protein